VVREQAIACKRDEEETYGVVDEDDDAIGREAEVGLDAGDGAVAEGAGKGRHGVLRQLARRSPVPDHERTVRRLHYFIFIVILIHKN
jgi:hypothetical protein